MKRFIAMLLAIMMIFALVACGNQTNTAEESAGQTDPPASNEENQPVNQDETIEPRIITDALGRQVEVPANIERIAALGNAQRLLVYLGLSDQVVGAAKVTRDNMSGITPATPFAYVNKELWADLPCIGDGNGDDFYPEEILVLQPDVIVCSTISEEAVLNLQEQTGIPVVFVETNTLFSEEYSEAFLILGQTCGVEDRAQEIVDYIDNAITDLHARTKDIPEEGKPSALSAAATFRGAHGIEGVRLKDSLLEAINAHNVAASSFTGAASAEVDREQILLWNPDFIFCDNGGVHLVRADVEADSTYYEQLSAYNEGRIYQHPSNTSYYSNLELPVANAYFMGSVLYPEQFEDVDIVQKINEVMEFFVGVENYYSILEQYDAGYGVINFGATE